MKIENKHLEAIAQALAEFFRVAVIASIPVIIIGLENQMIDWQLVVAVASIAFLKSLDKYLHKFGKATENESLSRGLTRF